MSTENGTETPRITRKGQVTIPKEIRDEFALEESDEVRWEKTADAIVIKKVTRSAGRGILIDEDVPAKKREEMAEEMEADIREKRRTE